MRTSGVVADAVHRVRPAVVGRTPEGRGRLVGHPAQGRENTRWFRPVPPVERRPLFRGVQRPGLRRRPVRRWATPLGDLAIMLVVMSPVLLLWLAR